MFEPVEQTSLELATENIDRLKELFPEIVLDGRVDFEALRGLLGDMVDDIDEKFGLNWHGKRRARQLALTPSTGTLRPAPEDSVDWDKTKHLMIEGDNLEVLKLLQKSYSGRVKLIYIDPPYNTGKDFVYKDDFKDNIGNYLELTGQTEEGRKVSTNTESSGRFHTDWLNMMYPRLRLARNLLRNDGAILISVDDTEVAHLRVAADEVFGEENFAAHILWQKKYAVSNDDPGIGVMHDHILMYRRSDAFERGLLPRTEKQDSRYTNPDDDPRGRWASDNYVSNKSKDERPTLWYSIKHPKTGQDVWPDEHAVWRYTKDKHEQLEAEGRLYWGPEKSYTKPRLKRYLNEVQSGIVPPTWWEFKDVGHNDEGQKETASLVGNKVFSTPKPTRLVRRMLTVGSADNDLIMDFFSGSGTTGHAVMAQNVEDGGNRRYILVQLPEPLDPDNKDQKVAAEFCDSIAKPRNIAELSKERLRRAADKIREEHPDYDGDLGFRVFKLDSSNIRAWDPQPEDLDETLLEHVDHLKEDRSEQDVLYELLLKLGLDLCVPIETNTIANKTVHSIGAGTLFACLDENLETDSVEDLALGIVKWRDKLDPAGDTTVVFRDSAFPDDVTKTNLDAILKQHNITTIRSI